MHNVLLKESCTAIHLRGFFRGWLGGGGAAEARRAGGVWLMSTLFVQVPWGITGAGWCSVFEQRATSVGVQIYRRTRVWALFRPVLDREWKQVSSGTWGWWQPVTDVHIRHGFTMNELFITHAGYLRLCRGTIPHEWNLHYFSFLGNF